MKSFLLVLCLLFILGLTFAWQSNNMAAFHNTEQAREIYMGELSGIEYREAINALRTNKFILQDLGAILIFYAVCGATLLGGRIISRGWFTPSSNYALVLTGTFANISLIAIAIDSLHQEHVRYIAPFHYDVYGRVLPDFLITLMAILIVCVVLGVVILEGKPKRIPLSLGIAFERKHLHAFVLFYPFLVIVFFLLIFFLQGP